MGFTRAAEDRPTPPEVYNYRPYILTCLACIGSWMFNYNNGVISGVIILPSFLRDFNLGSTGTSRYNNVTANVVSFIQIGGLAGSMTTFIFIKHWGRKVSMMLAAVVYFFGAALQTFCYGNLAMMYAGRIIAGLGAGSATVTVPLYIAELSPPAIRGSLVGLYEINNQLASLMGYWCNYIVNEYVPSTETRQWQIPLGMQLVSSTLLFFAALFILPESPRFLVTKGKINQSRKVLAFVRHLHPEHEYINSEIDEMREAVAKQSEPVTSNSPAKFGLFRELWWKGNRNRLLIGLGLMLGQNLTGINGVNFYTPTIFKSIGFQGTKVVLLASSMYAVVKTIATILSLMFFIDRTGRRKLLLISSVGSSLALWYIGAFVTARHVDLTQQQMRSAAGWVAIVCIYIYAAFFSFAWNGVVWVYCAEIFPVRIKELAVCICTAFQWLAQFGVARASPYMLSSLRGGFFFFFAACIVVMGAGVWWLVPETKGRTLEGMDMVFGSAYGGANHGGGEASRRSDLEGGLGIGDKSSGAGKEERSMPVVRGQVRGDEILMVEI